MRVWAIDSSFANCKTFMTVNMAEDAAPPLFYWICHSLNRWFLLINLELLNRGISQWEEKRHKVLMTWWPRWQLVKEKDRRLISQYVILLHHCLYTMLSRLFFTPAPHPCPFVVYYSPYWLLLLLFFPPTSTPLLLYYSHFFLMNPTLPHSSLAALFNLMPCFL